MKISSRELLERAELARDNLASCTLCARDCRVNRLEGELGYCGLDGRARCFREMMHRGEETPLNPSHQVYFSGCNLRCEFCSVLEWVTEPEAASPMDQDALVSAIATRRLQGARTLNLLGGEPAVNLPDILKLLASVVCDTQVVWNSNMYYGEPTIQWLDGVVDVYLADLKCANPRCSEQLLGAADYFEVACASIQAAARQCDTIVRHVLMPGHWDCCFVPVVEWVAALVPAVQFSLRLNYVPPAEARHAPLDYTSTEEQRAALDFVSRYDLEIVT